MNAGELSKNQEKTFILIGTASLVSGIFIIVMASKSIIKSSSYYLTGILGMIIGFLLLSYVIDKQLHTWMPLGAFIGACLVAIGAFFIVLAAYNAVDPQGTFIILGVIFICAGVLLTGYVLYDEWANYGN
jgi:hypothetical protein